MLLVKGTRTTRSAIQQPLTSQKVPSCMTLDEFSWTLLVYWSRLHWRVNARKCFHDIFAIYLYRYCTSEKNTTLQRQNSHISILVTLPWWLLFIATFRFCAMLGVMETQPVTWLLTRRWRTDVLGAQLLRRNIEGWSCWLRLSSSLFWCCTPQQSPGVKRRQSRPLHRCGRWAKQLRLLNVTQYMFFKKTEIPDEVFLTPHFLSHLNAWWPWVSHWSSDLCVGHTAPPSSVCSDRRIHLWGDVIEKTEAKKEQLSISYLRWLAQTTRDLESCWFQKHSNTTNQFVNSNWDYFI